MALIHSALFGHNSSHANATGVFASQTNTAANSSHHTLLYTSAKITGVILFIVLCALIILSAQASSNKANAAFEAADQSSALKLEATNDTESGASQAGSTTNSNTSTSFEATTGNSSDATDGAVQLDMNGESVTVPANSSYQKVITGDGSTTTVNVSTSTQGDANNRTRTTTRLNMSSSSTSSSDLSTKLKISGDGTGGTN